MAERLLMVEVHASHELRSPLARLRLSLEMLPGTDDQRQRVVRDLTELDGIIDEILEASRLDAAEGLSRVEPVDLLALVAEEGARTGAEVGGEAIEVEGDPRLLRRLVRNLLENARRHGGAGPVEAGVERGEDARVRLRVLDRGPGIPDEDRDRVFEPFSPSRWSPGDRRRLRPRPRPRPPDRPRPRRRGPLLPPRRWGHGVRGGARHPISSDSGWGVR